ncbi:MAG: M16 family metallopeptidase [Gammaproteobacteria bacterium]
MKKISKRTLKISIFVLIAGFILGGLIWLGLKKSSNFQMPWNAGTKPEAWTQVPKKSKQPKDTLLVSGMIDVHHWKTQAGIPVYFVPMESIPMLDLALSFPLGTSTGPEGASALMLAWLDEGFNNLGPVDAQTRFDQLAVQKEVQLGKDVLNFKMRTLIKEDILNKSLENWLQSISKANFKPEDFEKVKQRALTEIKDRINLPAFLAEEAFYKALYLEHPYSHGVLGTAASVQDLKPEIVLAQYQNNIHAKNMIITLVGGIHRDQAKKIAEDLSEKLKNLNTEFSKDTVAALEVPKFMKEGLEKKISHPSSQAHLWLGSPGRAASDEQKMAWLLGNHIFGEGMSSRLFKNIREKEGLVYQIVSKLDAFKYQGPFVIKLQTSANQAEKAKALVLVEWKNWVKLGPSLEELEKAKGYYKGAFVTQLSNHKAILDLTSNYAFYGLDFNLLKNYEALIDAVTLEEIKTLWAKQIPEAPSVVIQVGG